MQIWQLALIELRNSKARKALGCVSRAWLLESYAKLSIYCVLLPYELYRQREAKSSTEEEASVFQFHCLSQRRKQLGIATCKCFQEMQHAAYFLVEFVVKTSHHPCLQRLLLHSQSEPMFTSVLNSLNPKSDKHLISPYNITPESHIKVMRITEMITNKRNL